MKTQRSISTEFVLLPLLMKVNVSGYEQYKKIII